MIYASRLCINKAVGNPDYGIGHYRLDGAYGGWQLIQYRKYGDHDVTDGHVSKRALFEWLLAFLKGIEAAQLELKQQINQLTKGE